MDPIKHGTAVISGLLFTLRQNVVTVFQIDGASMLAFDIAMVACTAALAVWLFRHWLREAGDIAGRLALVAILTYVGLIAINVAIAAYANLTKRHPDWKATDVFLGALNYSGTFLLPNVTTILNYAVLDFGRE